jgi:small subunit ribosomal protein S16
LAVAIRLTRVGATKRPAYRVIAIDKRRSRDGRALEILGYYDPLTEPATVRLETDKIKAWIGKGAQPSDMVVRLMRQAEGTARAGADAPAPKRATRAAAAKPSRKAAAKAQAAAAAPEEAPDATEPTAEEAPAAAGAAAEVAPEEEASATSAVEEQTPAPDEPAEEAPVAEASSEGAAAETPSEEAAAEPSDDKATEA